MNPLFDYLWPGFAIAVAIGAAVATLTWRNAAARRRRWLWLAGGVVAGYAAMLLWSGPLGAADRYARQVEQVARTTITYYEMDPVTATLQRGPLTRRLDLAGPADDFQRSELSRVLGLIPGVHDARWGRQRYIPLVAESFLAVLAGFLLGIGLAYAVELHRRHNAEWNW